MVEFYGLLCKEGLQYCFVILTCIHEQHRLPTVFRYYGGIGRKTKDIPFKLIFFSNSFQLCLRNK